MEAGIYFPLYLVLVTKDKKKFAIYYLSADLQSRKLFRKRKPLSLEAVRKGWTGFTYDLRGVKDRFAPLVTNAP
jgi:hypothetical protein